MKLLLTNPWLFLTTVFWTIGGIVSIVQGNTNGIECAGGYTVLLGILYVITHQ